jgi:pimeloyl-ACP methyl ester carboxylesterase
MRLLFLFLLLLLAVPGFAQIKTIISPAVIFQQRVGVRPYAGKNYRLQARMKVLAANGDSADTNVFANVFDNKWQYLGGTGFGKMKAGPRASTWRSYTGGGRFAATADTMIVFANAYLNGTFGFDDFQLQVEESKDQWRTIPLVNGDFETVPVDSSSLPKGWKLNYQVATFTQRVVEAAPGQHYLEVKGRNVINYGHNAAAGHWAKVNGIRLYYETYGSGPPLLLLHGNGGSIKEVAYQIAPLARHFQVIAVDTRGQGQSGIDGKELTYDLFADDMSALLKELHLPAADVVGWSDGGNTGLSLTLHHPEQVRRLSVMGANLYADTTAIDAKLLKQIRHDKKMLTLVAPFKSSFRKSRRLVNILLKYPRMTPQELRRITAPTLVLAGEKDVIKEPHTRLIAASIPGAQLVIFPGLSHYAQQENPALFNDTVLRFLLAPAVVK